MRFKISQISVILSTAAMLGMLVAPASANTVPIPAEPPSTHCVTAQTKALNATVQAQLAKDIAPYASNAAAKPAIDTYQMVIGEAWAAMTLPYCGYGSASIADEIHSFNKTTVRARSAFLAAVAAIKKGVVVTPTTVPVPPPVVVPVPTPAPKPTPAPTPKPVPAPKVVVAHPGFFRGLHLGMRSDDVTELQKKLVAHFKLSTDGRVTGYFGSVTRSLLIKFQLEKKIITSNRDGAAGLIGPKTTAALNTL